MICAPKVSFHLVFLWGLIQQADSEPTWWMLMRVSFARGTATIQNNQEMLYTYMHIYIYIYIHTFMCAHMYTYIHISQMTT